MRVVFMGTPEFSACILESLAAHHDVVGVYTRPDAVRGRGRALIASPVKKVAQELRIPVFTPNSLRSDEAVRELAELQPDIVCVAAYGAILPARILELPRFGCVNVHASLLPRWRGAAPIERAILAGDEQAGVCIMRMEEGLDTGPYCVHRATPVGEKTACELTREMAEFGAQALLEALDLLEQDKVIWKDQGDSGLEYANKVEPGELNLAPTDSAEVALRKVRASSDAHPSKCLIAGKSVRVLIARRVHETPDVSLGQVAFVTKRLYLGCSDGAIEVTELKPDGKKTMEARAFAAGVQDIKSGRIAWEALRD
ncbi:methionyl-tRNA formyltransferase [Adlercreutzia sp. ZJ138]|uniref:methionyl-tRNA formyltransferase n=1 Tax=Adlercreutzia sp. ZJ138 TaxID=2709405 RepID=UPI0013EC58B1|nr:methionyl-tRNA formyltransferase [Adlercreutzia sp. ZJ138]